MHQYWANRHIYGVDGRGMGVNWVVAKASKMTQMIEFRVAMASTCTYNGPIVHYKA